MVLIKTALPLETSTVWLPSSTLWKVILSSQTNGRLIPKTGRGMGQFRHIDSVTSPKDGGPPSQLCAYICGLDKRGRVRRQETELPWEGGQSHACLHLPAIFSDHELLTDGQRRNGLCLSTQSLLGMAVPPTLDLPEMQRRGHQKNQKPPCPTPFPNFC